MDLTLTSKTWELRNPEERRCAIQQLELSCKQQEQVPLEPDHYFCGNVYARELFMPKGVAVVGKIHKHAHLNVISQGKVRVVTEFGVEELSAPLTFISKAGTKRAVYTLEDTVWTTFHEIESKDHEDIEKQVIANDYESLDLYLEQKK